jgi:hypothetical protein
LLKESDVLSTAKHHRVKDRIVSWSPRKKVLVLVMVGLAVYGATIALDVSLLTNIFGEQYMHADVDVYRARTSTILDGGLLYADVHTETPPLINYLLVPAQLLGGGDHALVYSAYFCFFGLLGALMLYLALRRYNDYLAFLMGLMFILSPFGFIEAGTGEDETIVAFTIILPSLLMLLGRNRLSTVTSALGIWTKMWAILLVPIQFLRAQSWREKAKIVIVILVITALVAIPFLILCGNDFTWFLRFYLIGDGENKSGGMSIFHFMDEGGIGIPIQVELAMVLLGLAIAYLYSYKKKLGVWESITLVMVVFFALYPKIHTGYYLIPITFLLAWAAEDIKIAARCFLIYIPVIFAVAFSTRGDGSSFFHFPGSWMFGLLASLCASIMLIETAYVAMKRRPFISRHAAGGDIGVPEEPIFREVSIGGP